jgi:hypothetical protein
VAPVVPPDVGNVVIGIFFPPDVGIFFPPEVGIVVTGFLSDAAGSTACLPWWTACSRTWPARAAA